MVVEFSKQARETNSSRVIIFVSNLQSLLNRGKFTYSCQDGGGEGERERDWEKHIA